MASIISLTSCARDAETHPRAQAKPPLEFLGEWGTKGLGPDQLQQPTGLAAEAAGPVYVADAGNGYIHKFSDRGEPLLAFQDPLIPTPLQIAVDSGGAIYASDWNNHRILVFLPTGERFREQGRGGARLRAVSGLAVDSDGNLFVTDASAIRVLKFDAKGRFRTAWGKKGKGPGEFDAPGSVAVGPDGLVYIVDGGNARVERFTRDGELVSVWGGGLGSTGLHIPMAIAVNERFAFVTDGSALVHVMTLDGLIRHTEDLTARVQLAPRTANLIAIALSGKDELLVLDSVGAKVLRFRINM